MPRSSDCKSNFLPKANRLVLFHIYVRCGGLAELSGSNVNIAGPYLDHGNCLAGCCVLSVPLPASDLLYIHRVTPFPSGRGQVVTSPLPGDIGHTRRPRFHGKVTGPRQSADSRAAMSRGGLVIHLFTVPLAR